MAEELVSSTRKRIKQSRVQVYAARARLPAITRLNTSQKPVRMQRSPEGRLKRSSALVNENVVGRFVGECPNALGLH
eukprot:6202619-Pleurochrysis_carterae.AAC.1